MDSAIFYLSKSIIISFIYKYLNLIYIKSQYSNKSLITSGHALLQGKKEGKLLCCTKPISTTSGEEI
jgi:hypothetical protein